MLRVTGSAELSCDPFYDEHTGAGEAATKGAQSAAVTAARREDRTEGMAMRYAVIMCKAAPKREGYRIRKRVQ